MMLSMSKYIPGEKIFYWLFLVRSLFYEILGIGG